MAVTFGTGASETAGFVSLQVSDCVRQLQKSAAIGFENVIRGELADVADFLQRRG